MALAISSSVFDALASSITRRSSLKAQDLGILARALVPLKQSRQAEYDRLAALPVWARTVGQLSGMQSIADSISVATKLAR